MTSLMLSSLVLLFIAVVRTSALMCLVCEGTDNSLCTMRQQCQEFPNDPDSTEVCQNDYRIVNNQVTIRKKCKQRKACFEEVEKNKDNNCDESGGRNTVCRCCCSTDLCNKKKKGCLYPSDCTKPGNPGNGTTTCPDSLRIGGRCDYKCNQGFKLVGARSTLCKRLEKTGKPGLSPPDLPICERIIIRCKPPHEDPENGSKKCRNSKEYANRAEMNYEGSVCKFFCDEFYELHGAQKSICRQNGKWSNPAPKCVIGKCKPLPTDPNREKDKCTRGYFVGSTCTFKCKKGYKLIGSESAACLKDPSNKKSGKWSKSPPKCSKIICEPVQKPPSNGNVKCTEENHIGSVCTFTCDKGYDMDKTDKEAKEIICEDDGDADASGKWNGSAPTCSTVVCQPQLTSPEGGKVECTKKNLLGSLCTFTCNDGYDVDGTDELSVDVTCDDNGDGDRFGEWSGPPATCSLITCEPQHENPENGKVSCTAGNREGSVCKFTCDEFYDVDGTTSSSTTSTCVNDKDGDASGVWKGPAATCTKITCEPPHSHPDNGMVSCTDENNLESECSFRCKEGYDLIGIKVSTCEDRKKDGDSKAEWSSKAPVCKKGLCKLPKIDESNIKRACRGGSTVQIVVGTICTYTCSKIGYYMTRADNSNIVIKEGKLDAECKLDKTWSEDPPMCRKVRCYPEAKAPDNGFMPKCTDSNNFESDCTFECESKYILSHMETMACDSDADNDEFGVWTTTPPTCEMNECEDFRQVKFGVIKYTNGNKIGSVGHLTCDDRYSTKKYKNITCLPAGGRRKVPEWDRDKYVCCVRCGFNPFIKIVMVVDKTAAANKDDWRKITSFTHIMLDNLNTRGYQITFAFVMYDEVVDTEHNLPLQKIEMWEDVDLIRDKLSPLPFGGDGSNTGDALNYANNEIFATRTKDEPYIVSIMGRKSEDSTEDAAKALRNKGISIIAVGFSGASTAAESFIGEDDLLAVSGDKKNIFSVDSIRELMRVTERIAAISVENGCGRASKTELCPK